MHVAIAIFKVNDDWVTLADRFEGIGYCYLRIVTTPLCDPAVGYDPSLLVHDFHSVADDTFFDFDYANTTTFRAVIDTSGLRRRCQHKITEGGKSRQDQKHVMR